MTKRSRTALRACGLVAIGAIAAGLYWRRHPSAYPAAQRLLLEVPHPLITRTRLLQALQPISGEHILEIGPGAGYYTLAVAVALAPAGRLEVFDIQQEMLDHTTRRVRAAGLDNVSPRQGDAQSMPYANQTFDRAYLVTVLGEIPDPDRALRELHRVLKAGGCLVVGELFGDPHWVRPKMLAQLARAAGFVPTERLGSPLGYFAAMRAQP